MRRPLQQGRTEVGWRPRQESILAPPCSNLKVFREQMYFIEEKTCRIVGLFRRSPVIQLPGHFAPIAILGTPLPHSWTLLNWKDCMALFAIIPRRQIDLFLYAKLFKASVHQRKCQWRIANTSRTTKTGETSVGKNDTPFSASVWKEGMRFGQTKWAHMVHRAFYNEYNICASRKSARLQTFSTISWFQAPGIHPLKTRPSVKLNASFQATAGNNWPGRDRT